MINSQLKEKISDIVMDEDVLNNIVVLEGDEFADGAIGVTDDCRVVYSYEKLVESLANAYMGSEEGIDIDDAQTDAIDWIEYNTLPSLLYMENRGLLAPVIIHEFIS